MSRAAVAIGRLELTFQAKSPAVWLPAIALLAFAFGAMSTDAVQVAGSIGNVHRNAPFIVVKMALVLSVLATVPVAGIAAVAMLREPDVRIAQIVFATPLTKLQFVGGKLTAALCVSVTLGLSIVAGLVAGANAPFVDSTRHGPDPRAAYVYAALVLVLPNLLLATGVFCATARLTRSTVATYVVSIMATLLYAIGALLDGQQRFGTLAALLDPFGGAAFAAATRYWTVAERNTSVLGWDTLLVMNRVLWFAIAAAAVLAAYVRARLFESEPVRDSARSSAIAIGEEIPPQSTGAAARAIGSSPVGVRLVLRQLAARVHLEVGAVLHSLPFGVLLTLAAVNIIIGASVTERLFDTPIEPRTYVMLELLDGGFQFYAFAIVALYSGQLVWRERELRCDSLIDPLPVSSALLWGAKLLALCVVVIVVLAVTLASGVGVQLSRGFVAVDLPLYLRGLGALVGVPLVLVAIAALFLNVLVRHKYVGFSLMALYYMSGPAIEALGADPVAFRFGALPTVVYSEMNGYAPYVPVIAAATAYWLLLASVLLVVVDLAWARGSGGSSAGLAVRVVRLARPRHVMTTAFALTIFFAVGIVLWHGRHPASRARNDEEVLDRRAEYERRYRRFADSPQPRITHVQAEVNLYPEQRLIEIRGRFTLRNTSTQPIDSIHLTLDDASTGAIRLDGGTIVLADSTLGYRIYELDRALAPGAETELTFDLTAVRGALESVDPAFVPNGAYFTNARFVPQLGYSNEREIADAGDRREHHLPDARRMRSIGDSIGRSTGLRRDSDWMSLDLTIGTTPSQVALAPGRLVHEQVRGHRRFFRYQSDVPSVGVWGIVTGAWVVSKDRWRDVEIAVYHDSAHGVNVPRMLAAVRQSLELYSEAFGPYQHRQVVIAEFPRYAQFAQSLPNFIPISEALGFVARIESGAFDNVTYVIAHEVAHQWWGHQAVAANVQGAALLSETMAQYSAMLVLERVHGEDAGRQFRRAQLNDYLEGRGRERIGERPLALVEHQPYIQYNKGAVAMEALRGCGSESALNAGLRSFLESVRFQGPPYSTSIELLDTLAAHLPPVCRDVIRDYFRTVTLWNVRAVSATARQRDDGRYDVRIDYTAEKAEADADGRERPLPLRDWLDVAVYGHVTRSINEPDPRVVASARVLIDGASGRVTLIADARPMRAELDPFQRLIERDATDNAAHVLVSSSGSRPGRSTSTPHRK